MNALDLDSPAVRDADAWTTADASRLYGIPTWSDTYFTVNAQGHLAARLDEVGEIDLHTVIQDLRAQGVTSPVLIRLQDILHARVVQLNDAFARAIEALSYQGRYTGVYPIKVNQLHEVVEEVLEAGRPYGMGLECGSKTELVATLAHLTDDDTLLICNGYKDAEMQRLMLTGQQLGKAVIPVIEKYEEFERFLRLAAEMDVRPRFGVRINLSIHGVGRWAGSSGDQSKFGVSMPELVRLLHRLEADDLTDALVLLHFHLGSQIANIQTLKRAVQEVTRIYVHLRQRGVPVQYLDVGGGLGVNYEATYTGQADSINYTLQEYANSVVWAVAEVCDAADVPHPTIISESGRALTAHHSVLVVEALGAYGKSGIDAAFVPDAAAHAVVHALYETWQSVRSDAVEAPGVDAVAALLEAYHDAVEKRQQSRSLFSLGYLSMEERADAESLYWTVCRTLHARVAALDAETLPAELDALTDHLVDQYLCDFSVFQSIPDAWAIGQRFPIVPIHRLDEEPTRRGILVDLTCDSDGKVNQFISADGEKRSLELHPMRNGEPYYLGFFLMGAYQDIMGDTHNLFGRVSEVHVYADADEPGGYYIEKLIPGTSVQEMLAHVQYFPNDLHRRMQGIIRQKVSEGVIRPRAGVEVLERYDRLFQQPTYLTVDTDPAG